MENFESFRQKTKKLLCEKIDSKELNLTYDDVLNSPMDFAQFNNNWGFSFRDHIDKHFSDEINEELRELFRNR